MEAVAPVTWGERIHKWSARADAYAVEVSEEPLRFLFKLELAVIASLAIMLPAGHFFHDDWATWLREGMPGTWGSGVVLLFTAVTARAIYRRDAQSRHPLTSFWGMSAIIFAVLVFVEMCQPTMYISHWTEDAGMRAPFGIENIDALLMIVVVAGTAVLLVPRAFVLLKHPMTIALFAAGFAMAVASQGLDSFVPGDQWEFVLEDGIKVLAEPLILGGFLFALRSYLRSEA